MDKIVFACATHAVYLVAFVLFKIAGTRFPRLSARHPLKTAGELLSSATWLVCLVVLMSGTGVAYLAVGHAPVSLLFVTYLLALPPLLFVATSIFGERLSPREWRAVALSVFAMVALAVSSGLITSHGFEVPVEPSRALGDPPLWKLAAVLIPSVAVPVWLFCVQDRKTDSRHGRPLTGVAYGIGAGVLLGTCEAFGLGIPSLLTDRPDAVLTSPYVWIFLVAGGLGIGLLQVALQQCRLVMICVTVNVIGKLQLLVAATLLYGEPWPADTLKLSLQCIGVGLALIAVFSLPRFERPERLHHGTPVPQQDRAPQSHAPQGRTGQISTAQNNTAQNNTAQTRTAQNRIVQSGTHRVAQGPPQPAAPQAPVPGRAPQPGHRSGTLDRPRRPAPAPSSREAERERDERTVDWLRELKEAGPAPELPPGHPSGPLRLPSNHEIRIAEQRRNPTIYE
ncbi:hypothetical protein GCM10010468_56400 [Actinocorallia longicatena]|uniref:Drug/metabolite transporter (DMT)-like permease n=1 Tax=Actinocorallia longicatena TaxID=111803 RepID=A0ABP6QH74_9ACTN